MLIIIQHLWILSREQFEAVAIDIGVAQYQIDKREEGAYVMLAGDDNKLASEQYAVGFKKGNEELRDNSSGYT